MVGKKNSYNANSFVKSFAIRVLINSNLTVTR